MSENHLLSTRAHRARPSKMPEALRPGRASRGMTLIELVIAMAIVAILAAIAIPAYNSYVLKSHRTEAKTALLDLASMEERFFSTSNTYSILPTDLGYTTANFPITVGNGDYLVSINAAGWAAATAPTAGNPSGTPATYSFTATAQGVQANDTACATFTISSSGQQTATGTDPNPSTDCWN